MLSDCIQCWSQLTAHCCCSKRIACSPSPPQLSSQQSLIPEQQSHWHCTLLIFLYISKRPFFAKIKKDKKNGDTYPKRGRLIPSLIPLYCIIPFFDQLYTFPHRPHNPPQKVSFHKNTSFTFSSGNRTSLSQTS